MVDTTYSPAAVAWPCRDQHGISGDGRGRVAEHLAGRVGGSGRNRPAGAVGFLLSHLRRLQGARRRSPTPSRWSVRLSKHTSSQSRSIPKMDLPLRWWPGSGRSGPRICGCWMRTGLNTIDGTDICRQQSSPLGCLLPAPRRSCAATRRPRPLKPMRGAPLVSHQSSRTGGTVFAAVAQYKATGEGSELIKDSCAPSTPREHLAHQAIVH